MATRLRSSYVACIQKDDHWGLNVNVLHEYIDGQQLTPYS